MSASYVGIQLANHILQLYFGNYWGSAKAVAKAIATTIGLASIKHGKVFKIKKWVQLTTVSQ